MMTAIRPDRADMLSTVTFDTGAHKENDKGMCVMECVAYVTGEPWSDHPQCVSPVIAAFLRAWNDALPEPPRTALLRPLVPLVIGTRTTEADEQTRAWLATDWIVRVHTPAFLRLAGLVSEAQALEGMARIADASSARNAMTACPAAGPLAYSAAYSAAVSAAVSAADSALDSAAYSAAGSVASAAYSAAGPLAYSAAYSAAVSAADSALDSAAVSAAVSALAPTVATLQESACELVKAMCAVGRTEPTS